LAHFLTTRPGVDTQLVLSASMKSADLSRVVESFEIFRPNRLLFTRLDETATFGSIFNEAARTGKPLSFFSNGQRIPEDLEAATRGRLSELILTASSGRNRDAGIAKLG
jgi:flagellar biosynthesis protein FlhF